MAQNGGKKRRFFIEKFLYMVPQRPKKLFFHQTIVENLLRNIKLSLECIMGMFGEAWQFVEKKM